MAMSEKGELGFFSPVFTNRGLWHSLFCHNPGSDDAVRRQSATTLISATQASGQDCREELVDLGSVSGRRPRLR